MRKAQALETKLGFKQRIGCDAMMEKGIKASRKRPKARQRTAKQQQKLLSDGMEDYPEVESME
jgi:hypothetical protein